MKTVKIAFLSALLCVLSAGVAQAATYSGTVTNKTTNKPAANDPVVLLDVQAGMAEVGHATTNGQGHYTISGPGDGPYLIRVTHQGGSYFIAAPQNGGPGDIPVFDVAKKVDGVSIEADVIEIEASNGQLNVTQRYFVHNTSNPPRTEYDAAHGFEIVLPEGAQFDGADARRPTGLPTSVQLKPASGKNHFQFDFPIQPDEGDKDTLFQFQYHLPYNGSYTFKTEELLPADNVAVLLPKSISFTAGSGTNFQSVPQDPSIQTELMKNVPAGKAISFTISGTGSMPRETQGGQGQGGQAQPQGQPGGGIGEPINTPDPLTKYKWWILGGLALLLAAAAAFLLRKPAGVVAAGPATPHAPATAPTPAFAAHAASPAARSSALLNALKEELFALESEKIAGTIDPKEYAEQKAALETVLRRALKK
ncbi:MAG: carboxypeptidase regulatory-like domain-containing protein [Acidobacteriota bacterium]